MPSTNNNAEVNLNVRVVARVNATKAIPQHLLIEALRKALENFLDSNSSELFDYIQSEVEDIELPAHVSEVTSETARPRTGERHVVRSDENSNNSFELNEIDFDIFTRPA